MKLFEWLLGKGGRAGTVKIDREAACRELAEAQQEYAARNLSFWICVNMIANALGRCEFRTFLDGKEVYDREYYLWNFEPNVNQNSTMFLHKLAAQLCTDNEVLMIAPARRDGMESIVIADAFGDPDNYPVKQNRYSDVVAGGVTYNKTFQESEVLHLKLNHINIKPVIDGLYGSYWRMICAVMDAYEWDNGQHWKVHVARMAEGDDFSGKFREMMETQIKPFLNSKKAVLPEFDGYKYERIEPKSSITGRTDEFKTLVEEAFNFTAKALQIPAVLIGGKVEGVGDARNRFLTGCLDPICDQLQEEITRKRYGFDGWKRGNYLRVDSSAIEHFDLFGNAPNVEKLVGSGAFCINDVLRAAGQPLIDEPWANEHFMTKNIAAFQEAAKSLEARKENT